MPTRDPAGDIGLFLTLVLLTGVLASIVVPVPEKLVVGQLALILFVHLWFSIYCGITGTWRTVTWSLLMAFMVGAMAIGFFGYMLPSGQMTFWAMTVLGRVPLVGPALAQGAANAAPSQVPAIVFGGIGFVLLCVDMVLMHGQRWWRALPALLILAAAAAATAFLLGWLIACFDPRLNELATPDPVFTIVPEWYALPFYAMLRCVPDKLAGVITIFAASLVPLLWPWMHVDRLRERFGWAWLSACIALAAIWLALGILGSQPADGSGLAAAQLLTLAYFLFFLALPPVLHRMTK